MITLYKEGTVLRKLIFFMMRQLHQRIQSSVVSASLFSEEKHILCINFTNKYEYNQLSRVFANGPVAGD